MICPHCNKLMAFRISDERRQRVIALAAEGYSARDIQALTGVSFSTAARIVRKENGKRRNAEYAAKKDGK
jgi:transposase